jgi:hypothetical protein
MKRDIVCPSCAKKISILFKTLPILCDGFQEAESSPYPNEGVKIVSGNALDGFICDYCATPIPERNPCFAVSIFHETRAPYFEWEHHYVNPQPYKGA